MAQEQAQSPFKWTVSDAGDEVTIELDGKPLRLTTKQLEIVAHWFGHIRAQMLPEVPLDVAQATSILPIASMEAVPIGPRPPVEMGCSILFRSAQLSWFRYLASADGCKDLVRLLTDVPSIKSRLQIH